MRLQSARCLLLGTQGNVCKVSAHRLLSSQMHFHASLSPSPSLSHTQREKGTHTHTLCGWDDVATYWPDPKLAVKSFPLLASPPQVPTVHTWIHDASSERTPRLISCKLAPAQRLHRPPIFAVFAPLSCKVSINNKCTTLHSFHVLCQVIQQHKLAQLHYSLHNFAPK
jgi:hypothetical protein